jgi:hypothetical protein
MTTKPKNDGQNHILQGIYCQALGHAPSSEEDERKCKGASHVLAWLGLGTLGVAAPFGCRAGYLLRLFNSNWREGKRKANGVPSSADGDVIESILDAGLGPQINDENIREFVCEVLAVLRLVRVNKGGGQLPTKRLKKLAIWRRCEERKNRCDRHEGGEEVAEWLLSRKRAALHIDPETAEVMCSIGQVLDPYGCRDLPEECYQTGRDYFARAPGSDIWVWFGDLPDVTHRALRRKHG